MTARWRWLIYAPALLYAPVFWRGRGAIATLFVPWRWTQAQLVFLFLGLCLAVVLGVWVVTWLRGGNAAVMERWAKSHPQSAPKVASTVRPNRH